MKFQADIRHNPRSDQYEITFSNFPEWLAEVFTHYTEIRLGSTQHRGGADPDSFTGALHITAHRPPPAESEPIYRFEGITGIRKDWVPADPQYVKLIVIKDFHIYGQESNIPRRTLFWQDSETYVVEKRFDGYRFFADDEYIIRLTDPHVEETD
jgi:hypothetical protein